MTRFRPIPWLFQQPSSIFYIAFLSHLPIYYFEKSHYKSESTGDLSNSTSQLFCQQPKRRLQVRKQHKNQTSKTFRLVENCTYQTRSIHSWMVSQPGSQECPPAFASKACCWSYRPILAILSNWFHCLCSLIERSLGSETRSLLKWRV